MAMQQSGQGEFSYTSEPRAAPMKGKGKYHNENEPGEGSINISADLGWCAAARMLPR